MRVAAYCRVSTDKEDQANSFETQQSYFRHCIEHNPDWELQEIYADEGLSGTSTKKRAQFHAMIRAAREGKIDLILTKEVSRFARNTLDPLEYTRLLKKLGVGVLFLIDNINTLDADGELRLTLMASLAQEESRKISHRVKWGQTQSMKRGVVFGGSLLGYDVKNGKIRINPKGAKTVRYIFHKYLNEHKGSGTIARELREEGVVSSRGNLNWSAPTVVKILKNEKYCGDLIQKKTYTPDFLSHEKKYNTGQEEFVVIRNHHEPIVDRATWDAVQRELKRRSRGGEVGSGHGNRYPLSGKIKCAACGKSFLCRTKKTKTGELYKIWRCGKATVEGKLRTDAQGVPLGCSMGRQIRETVALDLLNRSLQAVQVDPELLVQNLSRIVKEVMADSKKDNKAQKLRLQEELEGEMAKKQRALEEFLDRSISKADFRFMNSRCDSRIANIHAQISAMETQQALHLQWERENEDIRAAIWAIVRGERGENGTFSQLLHHMTIFPDGRVEVALSSIPACWFYTLSVHAKRNSDRCPVPEDKSVAFPAATCYDKYE